MVDSLGGPPRLDDLLAELTAARHDLARVDHATRMVRAQSKLESLLQAVRAEAGRGDQRRLDALAGEAEQVLHSLSDGTAARYPAEIEQARALAQRIRHLTRPSADGSVTIEV